MDLDSNKKDEENDDLEDGEIEDDDDDINDEIINKNDIKIPILPITPQKIHDIDKNIIKDKKKQLTTTILTAPLPAILSSTSTSTLVKQESLTVADLCDKSRSNKFKRTEIVDDDFAGDIENAIAAALKKDGVEPPPLPKLLLEKIDDKTTVNDITTISSKKRNRKRRKREEKEKTDNLKNKKYRLLDDNTGNSVTTKYYQDDNDDNDIDDYEMLCVRGGSPPPITNQQIITGKQQQQQQQFYDTDDSYSSFDSYGSQEYRKTYGERRLNRKLKDRRNRDGGINRLKDKDRNRDDTDITGRRKLLNRNRNNQDNNRDDSEGDDCGRSHDARVPRKLELCKFYLMECCAKKDKCSYMHSDFPCKYYYLGMDCVYKNTCKFSHGKPLTEQLRSILLKHIETAPKEILGTFRRISRDNATILLNKQHALLCQEFNIENTIKTTTSIPSSTLLSSSVTIPVNSITAQQNNSTICNNISNDKQDTELISNINNDNNIENNNNKSGIPSLLDMVINLPLNTNQIDIDKLQKSQIKNDLIGKPRKSRWCDSKPSQLYSNNKNNIGGKINKILSSTSTSSSASSSSSSSILTTGINTIIKTPSYLNLKNLTGIITNEQIDKLLEMGVENLEQISQLNLQQLNSIGLTINQINEIQLNTLNMEKLGVIQSGIPKVQIHPNPNNNKNVNLLLNQQQQTSTSPPPFICDAMKASTSDIDMRIIPTVADTKLIQNKSILDIGIASPELTNTNIINNIELENRNNTKLDDDKNIIGNNNLDDYSQYLKDSNLDPDKNYLLDDEKDDEEKLLVIEDDESELRIDESWDSDDDDKNELIEMIRRNSNDIDNDNENNENKNLIKKSPVPAIYDPRNLLSTNIDLNSTTTNTINSSSTSSSPTPSLLGDDDDYIKTSTLNTIDNLQQVKKLNYRDQDDRSDLNIKHIDKDNINKKEQNILSSTLSSLDKSNVYRDPRLIKSGNDIKQQHSPSPIKSPTNKDNYQQLNLYERSSIYDGNPNILELELSNRTTDKDMRMSEFIDTNSSDIDLRLPFKPVMTNFTPATEIDASLSTHSPIVYKVFEVDIPKPDYSEIRRIVTVNEKTLDPRLRRIFCLQETENRNLIQTNCNIGCSNDSSDSDSTSSSLLLNTSSTSSHKQQQQHHDTHSDSKFLLNRNIKTINSGPRIDPRRKIITNINNTPSTSNNNNNSNNNNRLQQQSNVDIQMLLQKSIWYKNLNSKYKIMVNQQLALISTELKKFHQNKSPQKIFDIQFILKNQILHQILTNLGIYIDDNGEIKQIELDCSDNDNNIINNSNNNNNNNITTGIIGNDNNIFGINIGQQQNIRSTLSSIVHQQQRNQMDFLRGPPPLIQQQQRNIIPPFGNTGNITSNNLLPLLQQQQHQHHQPRFCTDNRPGLLGIAPGIGFNPFKIIGDINSCIIGTGSNEQQQQQQQQQLFNNNNNDVLIGNSSSSSSSQLQFLNGPGNNNNNNNNFLFDHHGGNFFNERQQQQQQLQLQQQQQQLQQQLQNSGTIMMNRTNNNNNNRNFRQSNLMGRNNNNNNNNSGRRRGRDLI